MIELRAWIQSKTGSPSRVYSFSRHWDSLKRTGLMKLDYFNTFFFLCLRTGHHHFSHNSKNPRILWLNFITNFLALTCAITLAEGWLKVIFHLLLIYSLVYYAETEWVNEDDCLLRLTLKFPYLTSLYKRFMTLNLERFTFILSLSNLPCPWTS